MARKPRERLSEAYRKRIESAERRGKSRQAARGHKQREHVIRREREMEQAARTGALTSGQRQSIKRFLGQQAPRIGAKGQTSAELWQEHKARFEEKGYAWFLRVRAERNALVRSYKANKSRPLYGSVGAMTGAVASSGGAGGYDEESDEDYDELDLEDFDDDDGWMLFYH